MKDLNRDGMEISTLILFFFRSLMVTNIFEFPKDVITFVGSRVSNKFLLLIPSIMTLTVELVEDSSIF